MTCHLVAVTFGAEDAARQARFWAGLLERDVVDDERGTAVDPGNDAGYLLRFLPSHEPKRGQNRMHFDLNSTSHEDQQQRVERALELGARHIDVGQLPEEGHVVLADPEGNELCVIEPDNAFTAGCGLLGALACDGTQQVGYFWSEALGWPLVWDQDEETAIQSPHGGTKVNWGGPPVAPRLGPDRVRFDLAPTDPAGQDAEVERLLSLGARRLDVAHGDGVLLADPDGNEFCVYPSRWP